MLRIRSASLKNDSFCLVTFMQCHKQKKLKLFIYKFSITCYLCTYNKVIKSVFLPHWLGVLAITVRPRDTRPQVARILSNTNFSIPQKNVHLKVFWTLFKNLHCRGPCSLRPCISRPYCMYLTYISWNWMVTNIGSISIKYLLPYKLFQKMNSQDSI